MMSSAMDNSVGAVGAATAGQSSRVNLGAFRALPRDPSTGPPMPYPAAYPRPSMGTGGDSVRYGSGARSELREREPRRSPSRGRPAFEEGSVRQPNPAGPQTYLDWMEALNSFNA